MTIATRGIRNALIRVAGVRATRTAGRILDIRSAVEYRLDRRGRASAARLHELRDQYQGQRCFIIGNGPSLKGMDLAPLRDEYTFGLNRISLLFEKVGFETTFLVSVNSLVIEQSAPEILSTASMKFVSWRTRAFLPDDADVTYLRSVRGPFFSRDPIRGGIWEGGTVTFVAMQLAYHLGFEQAILIGVDHSFATTGPANKAVTSTGDDPNHFDPSYFGKGYRWQLPDLGTSEYAYRLAKLEFEAAGREIVDATVGGKLTVFRKLAFDDVVSH